MIDKLDFTIEQLLRNELDIDGDGINLSFAQPNGQWAGQQSGLALNLFLYDVRENPVLRRHQWQAQPDLEQRGRPGRPDVVAARRTPLMLDCFYAVSAWAPAGQHQSRDEHLLLSQALTALARYPILNPPFADFERGEVLAGVSYQDQNGRARERVTAEQRGHGQKVGEAELQRRAWLADSTRNLLARTAVEVRTRVAHHDVLTNPAEVWSALEAPMKAGFSYVVTLPLDPWEPITSYRVTKQVMDYSPMEFDPQTGHLVHMAGVGGEGLYTIGGTIYGLEGLPTGPVRLQLLHGGIDEHTVLQDHKVLDQAEHHFVCVLGPDSKYAFVGLTAGPYTLLIQLPSDRIVMREFTLSAAGPTGFDFTI